MNHTQLFHTANRLVEFLVLIGVPKTASASALGISRTTMSNWLNSENEVDSPTSPPSIQHLERLAALVAEQIQAQQSELLRVLSSKRVHVGTRRVIASAISESVTDASSQVNSLIESWNALDDELDQLVAKYGPSVVDHLADSTGSRGRGSAGTGDRPCEAHSGIGSAQEEETMATLPAELQGKTYRRKYEAVFDVLMHASEDDSAADLAARVRFTHPRGTFLPYRIGEDIRHLLRGDGVYTKLHAHLTDEQKSHLERLLARLKSRGELGR